MSRSEPKRRKTAGKRKLPRCHTCGRPIHIPKGWTALPAIRRHYWAKHRDVMQPPRGPR